MRYAFVIVGGILMILSVVIGVRVPEKWKMMFWSLFIIFVLAYISIGVKLEYDNRRRENELSENLKEERAARQALSQATSEFQSNLEAMGTQIAGLRQEFERIGPQAAPRQVRELQNRFQVLLQAYQLVVRRYSEESKRQGWPFGAHGANYPPRLHKWFITSFPEAGDLTGEDRFFLYLLIKRGGEAPRDAIDEFREKFNQEFSNSVGPFHLLDKLERLGFLEKLWPRKLKLAEPYYSRFKNMEIP